MGGTMPKQWKRGQRPKQHKNRPDYLNSDVRIPFFQKHFGAKRGFSVWCLTFTIISWSEKWQPACSTFSSGVSLTAKWGAKEVKEVLDLNIGVPL
jgi:hypothetical protein